MNKVSPRHPSMSSLDPSQIEDKETESATALPRLLFTWRTLGYLTDGQKTRQGRDRTSSIPDGRRDHGLWLLRSASIRQEAWRLLSERLIEATSTPLPISIGLPIIKRISDLMVSLILLGLLSPLFVLIAMLVCLESPGPAFFRQRRIGKDGMEFLIWKFRSMHVSTPKYAPSPTSDIDPRLTYIGRIIRRISLDELPQLLNVLTGDMSLVGPRPEMPFIVEHYSLSERRRLAVKPGITGLWQISPARAFPIHENLQYDLHYIQHQNLILDVSILLRTITAIIRGVGAV
jgi:lipopolysaccharide/colanic/teichoic acid biosynthesis glycosyltransferase